MEQLQCALLGYFGDVIRETGVDPSTGAFSHPAEVALVDSVIPMARDYEALAAFRERATGGRIVGFYANAVGNAVEEILVAYEDDVMKVADATELLKLRTCYATVFRKLVGVTQCTDTIQQLKLVNTFVLEPRLPLHLRCVVGTQTALSVLWNVAQWVAHGHIADSRDFFVVPAPVDEGDGSLEWSVDRNRLPPTWPDQLAAIAVVAGKERRVLLSDRPEYLGGHVSEDETSRATGDSVFKTIYDTALIEHGAILLDELESRLRTARDRWSAVMWRAVKNSCQLFAQLDAVRDMFLCRRGDLWTAFVANVAPRALFVQPALGVASRSREEQRVVADGFRAALQDVRLDEHPVYKQFGVVLREDTEAPPPPEAGFSIEALGMGTLRNVRRLALKFPMPAGMSLVVSTATQRRYVQLFTLHMTLKVALFAVHEVRRFSGSLARGNHTSSLSLRLMQITHQLNFLLTNISFCVLGDVQDTQYRALSEALERTTSVESARRSHDAFVEDVVVGAFLEDGDDVARAVEASAVIACGLYVVLQRQQVQGAMQASESRRGGADDREVARVLQYAEAQIRKRVVMSLSALANDNAHRALWTRLDFNRWFSAVQSGASAAENDDPDHPRLSASAQASLRSRQAARQA